MSVKSAKELRLTSEVAGDLFVKQELLRAASNGQNVFYPNALISNKLALELVSYGYIVSGEDRSNTCMISW